MYLGLLLQIVIAMWTPIYIDLNAGSILYMQLIQSPKTPPKKKKKSTQILTNMIIYLIN